MWDSQTVPSVLPTTGVATRVVHEQGHLICQCHFFLIPKRELARQRHSSFADRHRAQLTGEPLVPTHVHVQHLL